MAASVISISSDVSVKSVGSSFPWVILIGFISVEVPVAPKVRAAAVASPAGVLELDTHSSPEADPSESSPPPVSVAPMVTFSVVASRSSLPTTSTQEIPTTPILLASSTFVAPSSEFPLAPVVASPGIRRRRAILIRPDEDIPIGRLYRTHTGGLCRALTARKSVRPLPSHHLALRYTSHHLDRFTSGSSSGHSFLDQLSSRHSISGHSLSGHTPPDTTVADSSTPLRFVHPPLSKTLRCNEAYLHWRSAPLSTMCPPTTSESTTRDFSSESSAGPFRKRCRSSVAIVTSSIQAIRALFPSRSDLLPPLEVAVDRDVEPGVDAGIGMKVNIRIDVEDEVGSSDRGTMEVEVDIVTGIDVHDEIPLQRIEDIEMGQRELEARSLIAGGERASLLKQVASLERSNARLRGTMMMERRLETFAARRLEHPSDTKVLTMKMEILLEPRSNKLLVVDFNPLFHSFRALSTLRCSGLRMASTAAKPCQRDSLEVYLIIGRILMAATTGQKHVTSFKSISHQSVGFNSLVHSFRALSTLRSFGLRTASTAGKPCQGDSAEFYLITGSIYTDQRGTVVLETLFNESKQDTIVRLLLTYTCRNLNGYNCWPKRCQFTTPCSHFTLIIKDKMIAERPTTQLPQL
nr:hypothetical protein [Tanacetum cinerariifolium]